MDDVERDRLFLALTRPQMFAGVTYSYFTINAVLVAEGFLIARSLWVLAVGLIVHGIGVMLCIREPRFFDLWLIRISRCPRVRNHAIWLCNSYQP